MYKERQISATDTVLEIPDRPGATETIKELLPHVIDHCSGPWMFNPDNNQEILLFPRRGKNIYAIRKPWKKPHTVVRIVQTNGTTNLNFCRITWPNGDPFFFSFVMARLLSERGFFPDDQVPAVSEAGMRSGTSACKSVNLRLETGQPPLNIHRP